MIDLKIKALHEAQALLAFAKTQEADLRREVASELFGKRHGVFTIDGNVGTDYKYKASSKETRVVDQEALDDIWHNLPVDVQSVFKIERKLIKKRFDLLAESGDRGKYVDLILDCITTKPAMPSIKVDCVGGDDSQLLKDVELEFDGLEFKLTYDVSNDIKTGKYILKVISIV